MQRTDCANREQFVAGDGRATENIALASIHTLFLREHNRLAAALHSEHPSWNDETLYQEARKRVNAQIAAIVYEEWLPILLGKPLPPYSCVRACP